MWAIPVLCSGLAAANFWGGWGRVTGAGEFRWRGTLINLQARNGRANWGCQETYRVHTWPVPPKNSNKNLKTEQKKNSNKNSRREGGDWHHIRVQAVELCG